MIEERYCSYEVSKLLKEKGFKIGTNKDYWKIGEDGIMYFMSSIGAYTSNPNDEYAFYRPENSYPCPTHQMAMDWLREEKYISIVIDDNEIPLSYKYVIKKYSINDKYKILISKVDSSPFIKYEDAVEAALKYTLENLI